HLGVLDAHLEDPRRPAAHLGADAHLAAVDDLLDELPALPGLPQHAFGGDTHVLELHLAELPGLIHGLEEGDRHPRALAVDQEEAHALRAPGPGGAAGDHQETDHVRPGHAEP